MLKKAQTNRLDPDLCVSESCDGHPRDPAVLQVPVSRRNDDLVQEVHAREVMIGHLDDVRGQRQGRPLIEGQVRHLQSQPAGGRYE